MSEPINAADMSPKDKLTFLRDQIIDVRYGKRDWVLCPYCGAENRQDNPLLCCRLFNDASVAILSRLDLENKMEFLQRIGNTSDTVH